MVFSIATSSKNSEQLSEQFDWVFLQMSCCFGKNVDLKRGIFKDRVSTEKLVECPKYVQNLVRMQEEILKSSQESFANHVDQRIAKKQKKNGTNVKKFDENDLVITVREVGSKLDYKWKGPFRVIKHQGQGQPRNLSPTNTIQSLW